MTSGTATWMGWLRDHQVTFDCHAAMLEGPDQDGPLLSGGERATFQVPGQPPIREVRRPDLHLGADHVTRLLGRCLGQGLVEIGRRRAIDLACGTGCVGVLLHRMGARSVVLADVYEEAVACARGTLAEEGLDLPVLISDIWEGIDPSDSFDLVVATLPHKPTPQAGGSLPFVQSGGADGTALFDRLLAGLPDYLAPGGQLVFCMHSLTHPKFLAGLAQRGRLQLLATRRRFFGRGEYGAVQDWFVERSAQGTSHVATEGDRRLFYVGVWAWEPEA